MEIHMNLGKLGRHFTSVDMITLLSQAGQ